MANIEYLDLGRDYGEDIRQTLEVKINEMIDMINKLNNHVHYTRELQFSTSTPDNPNVYE